MSRVFPCRFGLQGKHSPSFFFDGHCTGCGRNAPMTYCKHLGDIDVYGMCKSCRITTDCVDMSMAQEWIESNLSWNQLMVRKFALECNRYERMLEKHYGIKPQDP